MISKFARTSDAVQPLDAELPLPPAMVGVRGRRVLWIIGILALALRLLLLPLGHWWDVTVDYNVFIDLARNISPYDNFSYLSNIAISAGWDKVYEYYAYPPIPLYIYYLLAKIYVLLHPHVNYFFAQTGSNAVPNLSLDFFFLLKLPIWVADFLIAALLMRLSGTIRGFRDYLLNPFVLLVSGAWTFDAIMLLGLVAAVYWLHKGKMIKAGTALAFGTMVKFFPVITVPTLVIYLIKKNRPLREIALFLVSYVIACLVFLGPFAQGVMKVLSFHANRPGGGMSWQVYWTLGSLHQTTDMLRPILDALSVFGIPMLIIAMLLAYWYIWQTEISLNRMIIVTLLGFFLGSKLINEQYALLILPFAWLDAYRVGGAWRWFYRLFWIVPLAFTIVHVPIGSFLWLFYHAIFEDKAMVTIMNATTGFEWTMIGKNEQYNQFIELVLGVGFFVMSVVALLWPVRPIRRFRQHYVDVLLEDEEGVEEESAVQLRAQQPRHLYPTYVNNTVPTSINGSSVCSYLIVNLLLFFHIREGAPAMLQHYNVSITPTLRVFISKVITPVVLVAGLLVLILFNFQAVLKATVSDHDHFHGEVSFSQGAFAYCFLQTSGIDRPVVRYDNLDLLTYAEWSSTFAIDGNVQQLWDANHGYSYDEARRQVFSTIDANGGQLNEVVSLVDDHTIKVVFNLVPQPPAGANPPPLRYVLDIAHVHHSWYGYQATNDTFRASVKNGGLKIGTILFQVEGNEASHLLVEVDGAQSTVATSRTMNETDGFISEYVLENPTPYRIIPLGTETITFQPTAYGAGTPLPMLH